MKLMIVTSTAWLVLCSIVFSNAGTDTLMLIGIGVVACIWMLIWSLRLLRELVQRRRQPGAPTRPRRNWLVEPLVLVVCLMASHFGLFAMLRFSVSERALTSYANQVRSGDIKLDYEFNHPRRQVGLYGVVMTDRLPDGSVRMLTSSHGLLDRAGFVWSPSSPPPRRGEDTYSRIRGQWWYWRESW